MNIDGRNNVNMKIIVVLKNMRTGVELLYEMFGSNWDRFLSTF